MAWTHVLDCLECYTTYFAGSSDPFECELCGARVVVRLAIAAGDDDGAADDDEQKREETES